MGYRNPTLTEIIAELHLEVGTLPEKSFMALARELAVDGLDDQEFGHMAIVLSQDEEKEPEPKFVPRIRCWDSERIRLVQFSPDVVYVNLVGEYPGWDKFSEHIRTTHEAVTKALKSEFQLTQIELTTIDRWKANLAGFTTGQYLNCSGPVIPKWYSEVSVSSDISLGQGFYHKDGFNKKIKITVRTTADNVEFQVLITFGETYQEKNFDALMERLHRESVQCFEELITDRVREEIMGGKQ